MLVIVSQIERSLKELHGSIGDGVGKKTIEAECMLNQLEQQQTLLKENVQTLNLPFAASKESTIFERLP